MKTGWQGRNQLVEHSRRSKVGQDVVDIGHGDVSEIRRQVAEERTEILPAHILSKVVERSGVSWERLPDVFGQAGTKIVDGARNEVVQVKTTLSLLLSLGSGRGGGSQDGGDEELEVHYEVCMILVYELLTKDCLELQDEQ